jgi:putative ABC transport system permease protein
MIKNYFIIAWRNLLKNKVFSVINILGLSIGLACCILMFLFIQHELSYDKFNIHSSNIYRITSESESTSGKTNLAVTPAPWAPLMKKDLPEINNYVRIFKAEKSIIGQPGQQKFYENDLLFVDSTFFDVFSFSLQKGNSKQALEKPNSIVLTRETAEKYFGNEDPIGKTLEINSMVGILNVEITGIVNEIPSTSHFKFNALISLQSLGDISGLWAFHMFQSYVLINNNVSTQALEKKFAAFANKYINNNPQADGKHDIHLQPLNSIHLNSKMIGEIGVNGDIKYVYIFTGIAVFILLIACFNFTNLSTARSLSRAKEVGLRKVVGAEKQQLIRQFLSETILFALIALTLAIIIAILVLPLFNQLSGRQMSFNLNNNYALTGLLVLLVLFVGLLAGIYPAVILSSFKPVEVLKSKFQKTAKGVSFRKVLVTLQFVISIALIASTIIVTKQLQFLKNKKLGFDKENVAIVTLPKDMDSAKLQTFKNSILNSGVISNVAGASSVPGVNIPINQVNDGNTDLKKALSMQMLFTDHEFIKTMNMKILAGRDFSSQYATDKTEGFILNEEAVKKAGWKNPAEAIGKTFQWVNPGRVVKSGKVIGIVQNFNITPLKAAVQPLVMHYSALRFQYLYVRFNQLNAGNTIDIIGKKFKEVYPKQSFEYSYLDETLNQMYAGEKKISQVFSYFSFLAILIACMGILGLSLYSIQQRIKEIGIRKVLGASVTRITAELVKDFLKPVLIAAIIAFPIAWYAMDKWLQDFAYRTNIGWWIFIAAGLLAVLIAMITIGVQAVKAAIANPVKSLRTE